ncbi:MAG: DUF3307 domain-containing protein [Flavobacteriaceae bacterium]|nr:DUF3307 domain-containing protein [Flavobacteriaceae bacterium]
MTLFLKLLLAHIIGDFFLQTKASVRQNETKKLRSPQLYLHIAIHFVLLFILVWDLSYWPLIVFIGTSHFIIDAIKLSIQTEKNKRLIFVLDQIFHLLSIVFAYYFFTDATIDLDVLSQPDTLLLIVCLIFLTRPASIIMKIIFSKWDIEALTKDNASLKDAGSYIGILERILVFIFIVVGHWEAVGFLITAKSVFRFGDLKESKHRKLTEYILIGTLISFGIAIIVALLFTYFVA